jgi:hypothetical protein
MSSHANHGLHHLSGKHLKNKNKSKQQSILKNGPQSWLPSIGFAQKLPNARKK